MEKIDRKEYINDVIASCIDIDPMAMYYVWEKMNDQMNQPADLREKDEMLSACVDEMIVGINQSLDKYMAGNSQTSRPFFQNDLDRWIEAQPELNYAREHMTEWAVPHAQHDFVWFEKPFTGLENMLPEMSSQPFQRVQASDSDFSNDFIWFESSLDRWLDSQPDLKQAIDHLPDPILTDEFDHNKADQQIRQNKVA